VVRRLVIAAVLALAVAQPAFAGPVVAEVRGPTGALVEQARAGARSPGSAIQIGESSVSPAGVELRDVALLGGRIWVGRIFVPAHGLAGAEVRTLVVGGHALPVRTNGLVPLAPQTYLVALQKAVLPGRKHELTGVVGLRLYVGDPGLGVAPGTQILVGLARAAGTPKHTRGTLAALVLGLDPAQVGSVDAPSVPGPFDAGSSLGARAVSLAERFVGISYVWGGASPAAGFDCSGLTMFVYGQLGIHLTHFAGAQWSEGVRVPASELQPGDLVFFEARPTGPNHVGIYIGGGRFLHAPHTGDVVKTSSLSEPWYALQYVGAVRPY
jgi:NlpC/P60 family